MFFIHCVFQALAGMNSRRKVYSVLRGAFNNDGITEYVREMTGGRGRITKFREDSLPAVNTLEPWDGRDGEVRDHVTCHTTYIIYNVLLASGGRRLRSLRL